MFFHVAIINEIKLVEEGLAIVANNAGAAKEYLSLLLPLPSSLPPSLPPLCFSPSLLPSLVIVFFLIVDPLLG